MGKTKKRASSSSRAGDGGLVGQGRQIVGGIAEGIAKDVHKRLPQLEKAVSQGQKTLKTIQDQVRTTAKQSDIDKLTKRIDAVAKQLERMVTGAGRAATSRAAARPATAKAASSRTTQAKSTAGQGTAGQNGSGQNHQNPAPGRSDPPTTAGPAPRDRARHT